MKEKRKKINCELGQAKTGKGIMRNFMEVSGQNNINVSPG